MCNCRSYNGQFGTEPPVALDPNEYFEWDNDAKTVSVDACIATEIKALWDAGIWTRGCCCGHNGRLPGPNVVIDRGEDPEEAIAVLERADPSREWDVLQWQLVKCSEP